MRKNSAYGTTAGAEYRASGSAHARGCIEPTSPLMVLKFMFSVPQK
jgi:hypothetical protein